MSEIKPTDGPRCDFEIDYNGFRAAWWNIKDFWWFVRRGSFKKGWCQVFQYEREENYIYIHVVMMQFYIKTKHRSSNFYKKVGN